MQDGILKANASTEAETASIERPRFWIEEVQFSDDTRLAIGRDDIIVLVGPNNAGKSRALRDIYARIANHHVGKVITDVKLDFKGTADDVVRWAESLWAPDDIRQEYQLPMTNGINRKGLVTSWNNKGTQGLHLLTNSFCLYLDTEQRLKAASPVDSLNSATEYPTNALQVLYDDDEIEARVDRIFKRAFGTGLIVDRGAGKQIVLHIGSRPTPPGGDRQAKSFRRTVNALPPIQEQGDGMRSFAGVLASVLVADRDVVLIDEPEAFLHPPQAVLLGRVPAEETPGNKQLFISTHSIDVLRGLLDRASGRVRVIRLTRVGNINDATELSPSVVKAVWADPLLRYSKVLDALFHQGAIVCEADADCRFYEAITDAISGKRHRPDVSFVYGAGKSRTPTIVRALRAIGVPVRVIVDFDALADEANLKNICEALGGTWSDIGPDCSTVRAAIEAQRPRHPARAAKEEIDKIFATESAANLTDAAIKRIKDILRGASGWSEAKRMGRAFVPKGDATSAYLQLVAALRQIGVWLVEVSELEGFCPSVPGHGPTFVTEVLGRNLLSDPELRSAREFMASLIRGWPATDAIEDEQRPPN